MLTSVLLPVYNGANYIEESILSVLKQKGDWELIIQDDCSTDDTEVICEKYLSSRIKYFKNEKSCKCWGTLNAAVQHSNGNLLRLFSHDDIMLEDDLIISENFLNENQDIGICFTNYDKIDNDGKITGSSFDYVERNKALPNKMTGNEAAWHLYKWGCISGSQSNITIRKEIYDAIGGFNGNLVYSGDFDLLVRAAIPYGLGYCREKTCAIRFHNFQTSNVGLRSSLRNTEMILILDFLYLNLDEEHKRNAGKIFSKIYGYQMINMPIKSLAALKFKPVKEFYKIFGAEKTLLSIYNLFLNKIFMRFKKLI